jgi:hypothetical protein
MIPSKLDLLIWRGTSFEIELISQMKNYTYDPDIHTSAADLKRSYAENLKHYGFVYEYVDFATLYPEATLNIMKPWRQNSNEVRKPLFEFSLENERIELTSKSVKLGISAADTQELEFDAGTYKLLLITATGKVDGLVYGNVKVEGER